MLHYRKDDHMVECVGLFMLYTAIVFGTIVMLGSDLCFKEKAKILLFFEIYLALLIIGAYIFVG